MSAERYSLDANILFYALDADAGRKHEIALQLWMSAAHKDCILTLQAVSETFNAVSRKAGKRIAEAEQALHDLITIVPVVCADETDLKKATQMRQHRPVQFWDAMLLATARRAGCQTLLTEDAQDRPISEGVRYLNPFLASFDELERFF